MPFPRHWQPNVRERAKGCPAVTAQDLCDLGVVVSTDSPDLAAAKRLLDAAKRGGFSFQRVAPGPDGPLWGVRDSLDWLDTIYLAGFGHACTATRARKSPLIIPGGPLVTQRVHGDAPTVLLLHSLDGFDLPIFGCQQSDRFW